MKKLIALSTLCLFACDNKPVSSEYLKKVKEDSAIQARESEIYTNIATQRINSLQLAPVKITSSDVYSNDSRRWITIEVVNGSNTPVDGLRIGVYYYNNFNELLNTAPTTLETQERLNPNQKTKLTFDINTDGVTKAKLYIEEIHFTNDSTWNFKNYVK
jgi:hypothetical protein